MDEPAEWKTWKLWKRTTIPLAVLDVAIAIIVLALERTSTTHNGIATIPSIPTTPVVHFSASNMIWSYGLLWTALPAFLMTLYRMAWDTVVTATADRQPFIELARSKENASSVRRTIMLDYRFHPSLYNWVIAFRHKHHLLGFSMLLSVVLSVALVPLTSHLFTATLTEVVSNKTISVASTFDDEAVSVRTDLQAAMNIAASVSIFGATPPPWSTIQYAFEPFNVKDNTTNGNVTARITGYSGLLDCQVKTESEFSMTKTDSSVTINGVDRDCVIPDTSINIGNTSQPLYALAWSTLQCGQKAHYSRFGIVTGGYSDSTQSKLANLTVLSCIPSYWQTSGWLTVNVVPNKPATFANFLSEENNATEFRPFFYTVVERNLPLYIANDPSNSMDSDLWGRLVYSMSDRQNPGSPLDPVFIKSSMETLFSSFIASMASTYAFKNSTSAREVDATVTERLTRLFVVSPVAWTVVIIMCLVFICNIFLIFHAERNKSILNEEPVGLLGSAALLQDSDLSNIIAQLRGKPPKQFNVREMVEKECAPDTSQCWYDFDTKRILVSGMMPEEKTSVEAENVLDV
jgi:hypothetical protein